MVTVPGQIRNTLLGKGGQEGECVWQMAGDGVWGWASGTGREQKKDWG